MAKKRKPPKGQINKRNDQCIKALHNLMEDLGEKYSIRVGIIGQQAAQKHRDTDLTNAELGAIHEFGASMTPTEKQKGYFWHRWGIHKSNKQINIPARSFLRVPLLSKEGKKAVIKGIPALLKENGNVAGVYFEDYASTSHSKTNEPYRKAVSKSLKGFLNNIAIAAGQVAVALVMQAFDNGGFPTKWEPTSEWSKKNRKYNPANPTLIDSGDLRESISYEVKEGK